MLMGVLSPFYLSMLRARAPLPPVPTPCLKRTTGLG